MGIFDLNCLQCLYHAEIKREIDMISLVGAPEYCKLKLELLRGYDPCEYFISSYSWAQTMLEHGKIPGKELILVERAGLREIVTGHVATPDRQDATQLIKEFEDKQDVVSLYRLQKFLTERNIYIRPEDVEEVFRRGREFIVSTKQGRLSGYAVAVIESLIFLKLEGGTQQLFDIKEQLCKVGEPEGYDRDLIDYFNPGRMIKEGIIKADRKAKLFGGFEASTVFELDVKGEEILSGLEAKAIELLKFIGEHDGCQISEVRNHWLAHCANAIASLFSFLKEQPTKEQWSRLVFDQLLSQGFTDVDMVGDIDSRPAFACDTNLVRITKKGKDALEQGDNILKALSLCDISYKPRNIEVEQRSIEVEPRNIKVEQRSIEIELLTFIQEHKNPTVGDMDEVLGQSLPPMLTYQLNDRLKALSKKSLIETDRKLARFGVDMEVKVKITPQGEAFLNSEIPP